MVRALRICWQGWNGESNEHLSLRVLEEEVLAAGTIVNVGNERFVARYSVTCDGFWVTRKLSIELEKAEKKKTLALESDGKGTWTSNCQKAPNLTGAIDIDLSVTPFTNTLPIRRLKLKEKQTSEIQVVYVLVPELEVSLKTQRYTCIVPNERYLFEQPSDNFRREIIVDEEGLVKVYPLLFKRVNCASVC